MKINNGSICALALVTLLLLKTVSTSAQIISGNGTVYYSISAADVEEDAYQSPIWTEGSIDLKDGKRYTDLKLKYDVVSDRIIYQDKSSGEARVLTNANIKGFILKTADKNMFFFNSYPAVDKLTPSSFYQLLADGKTQLLKHISKDVQVSKEYNGPETKTYTPRQTYYIYKNNIMHKIKPDAKSIMAALADRATELNAYINANHISFKNDGNISMLIDYYNTL